MTTKKAAEKISDDLRPEYDLSKLTGSVRGKYYKRATAGTTLVLLEPDVAEALDVGDELVEHRDPRVPADAERMHDEQEAAAHAVRPVEFGLPDLEHLGGRRGFRDHEADLIEAFSDPCDGTC